MNLSKKRTTLLFAIAMLSATGSAFAADAKPSTLLYISPNDYNYSVHLLHPYYNYWFTQGPIVEPIAFQALSKKYSTLAMCKNNETAESIIRIKPSLFYNPQSRVYYGKLEATVYSGSGNVLGKYIGEAQQQGYMSVDVGIPLHLNKVYSKAMQILMTKLDAMQVPTLEKSITMLPCGLIASQTEQKIDYY